MLVIEILYSCSHKIFDQILNRMKIYEKHFKKFENKIVICNENLRISFVKNL